MLGTREGHAFTSGLWPEMWNDALASRVIPVWYHKGTSDFVKYFLVKFFGIAPLISLWAYLSAETFQPIHFWHEQLIELNSSFFIKWNEMKSCTFCPSAAWNITYCVCLFVCVRASVRQPQETWLCLSQMAWPPWMASTCSWLRPAWCAPTSRSLASTPATSTTSHYRLQTPFPE